MISQAKALIADIEQKFPGSVALIVGGAVRDIIMGNEPHDIDIATNADINDIAKRYDAVDIGASKEFGIVSVGFQGERFEVAAFRTESGTSDNRHPDEVQFVDNFEDDAARRDFTINAMGYGSEGVIDPHGGIQDITNRIIRAVGNPDDRFEEDALRILRAARFAARFGYYIEPDTKAAMIRKAHLVKHLSVERITGEVLKTAAISGTALAQFIETLNEVNLLDDVFPLVNTMRDYEHTPETHPEGGVFDHTLSALRKSRSSDPIVNIALVYHDIGKTRTRTYNDHGHVCYKGHEAISVKLFKQIAKEKKFSNAQIEAAVFAIENHMIAHRLHTMKKSKVVAIRQSPFYRILIDVCYADDASREGLFDEDDFAEREARVEALYKIIGERAAFEERMKPLINGRMIMNLATDEGVSISGPDIGKIKNAVREVVIEKDFDITLQDTSRMVREMVKEIMKENP